MGKCYKVYSGRKSDLVEGEPQFFLKRYTSRTAKSGIVQNYELIKIERIKGRIKQSFERSLNEGDGLLQKFLDKE